MPVAFSVSSARVLPMPYMYVRATSSRLSRGRSTPTRRAIVGNSPSHPEVLRAAPRLCPQRGPGLLRGCQARQAGAPVRHVLSAALALPLLVPRVRADHHDPAMPTDDPAFAADLLHTRLDLHGRSPPGPGPV